MDASGVSKVLIHLDTDVSDPAEIIAAVGTDPNGMNIDEVVSLIGGVASEKELVGLTVAEPAPPPPGGGGYPLPFDTRARRIAADGPFCSFFGGFASCL